MSNVAPLTAPFIPQCRERRYGKVRDIYALDHDADTLIFVASDRISTFDVVHPTPIPDKGRVLTQLSAFWFSRLGVPHHALTTSLDEVRRLDARIDFGEAREWYEGRTMLVRRVQVFPVECVVRGYLAGSGWKDYKATGSVCGIALPQGLRECEKLPEPIFTPATKAAVGHDENIDAARAAELLGSAETVELLRRLSVEIYSQAAAYARERGIIIADTKFEFGRRDSGPVLLVDEALTPDSSRFWPLDQYEPGRSQPSFDKQFVRDYVTNLGWNKQPPAPPLPLTIVHQTRDKYIEAFERLTGQVFRWKVPD